MANEQMSHVPYWLVFIAGLLAAIILMLGGVMLGCIAIKPMWIETSTENESTTSAETAGWKTYSNSTMGFSAKYPSTWLVSEGNSHAPSLPEKMVNFQSEQGSFDISVITEDKTYSSKEEAITQFVKNNLGSYVLSSKIIHIGSYEGLESFYIQGGMGSQLKVIYTVLENGGRFYYIGTQTALNPQTNEPENTERLENYNNLLSTFQFLDETAGWKTYSNSTMGFSIQYPSELTINEQLTGPFKIDFMKDGSNVYWMINEGWGGMLGIQNKKESIIVDGKNGNLFVFLSCRDIVEDFNDCQRRVDAGDYDGVFLEADFGDNNSRWYIIRSLWNKGEKNINEEVDNLKVLLSTFKFLD